MVALKSPPSPLRADPTRTATLRRRFEQAIHGRMVKFKGAVNHLLVVEDVFGLKPMNDSYKPTSAFNNVANTRWRFRTSDEKKLLFEQWMATQIDKTVLSQQDKFWEEYIQRAYMKGQGRAFDDFMKGRKAASDNMDFIAGSRQEFLTSAFRHPPSVEKVKLLASRVYTDLKDVTDTMSTQMSRTLVDGLIQGTNPRQIASTMAKQVDGLTKKRANVIARTEIIRAHADGQLDGFERMGMDKVGVMVEWAVTPDERLCPLCAELNGVVLSIKDARGLLPRHPNCRCAYLPAQVGEGPTGQKKNRQARKAIDRSIQKENPKRSLKEQKELSKWSGADLKVGKSPKPVVSEGALNKAKRYAKRGLELSNLGPSIAAEVAREAGISEKLAKAILVSATVADFAVPGIPVGSMLATLLVGAKDPKAVVRAVKAVIARLTGKAPIAKKIIKKAAAKKVVKKATKKGVKKSAVKTREPKVTPKKEPIASSEESLKKHIEETSKVESYQSTQVATAETLEVVEIDGVIYRYPPDKREQVISDIIDIRENVGPNLRAVNKEVSYLSQASKNDEYWQKQFNKPDFFAMATGGGPTREIVVYRSGSLPRSLYTHESGHNLAMKTWGDVTPPIGSNYAKAQALEKPVSSYGALNPAEDFAEAVKMYADKKPRPITKSPIPHDVLKKEFPNKYKAIQELLGDG